jgi:hypothetical protein
MSKKLVLPPVAAAAIAFPAAAGAVTFHGVVVAKQPRRHALIIASPGGVVRAVHTHHLATRVGARVAVVARRLSDGTFSARHLAVRGRAHHARIHGVVAKRLRGGYLLAAGHSVLTIRTHQSFALNDTGSGPTPGTVVNVTVDTNDSELDQEDVDEVGEAQEIELEGKVASVTPPTNTVAGEIVLQVGASTIHVVVPAGMTLPALNPGDNAELEVTLSGSTFTLVKAEDENDDEGDDAQGDDDGGGDG